VSFHISASHGLAILALLATSLLVRVLPVFLKVGLSDTVRGLLERVLPMAVFLNFAVYIVWTEISSSPVAAAAAILAVAVVTFSTRAGLVLTTCLATLIYAAAQLKLVA
jgi:branched-subunit amino acid transport protein AzlD